MDVIKQRGKTHGNFLENARISQTIKSTFKSSASWEDLSVDKKESLEMIALKLSRILSGHGDFKDHWSDISGYARLVEDTL